LIKFAVSTSLFEGEQWIGVVSGSITAASTLELPRLKRSDSDDRLTVLMGPFEGERLGAVSEPAASNGLPEFTFLAHPKLGRGEKVTLPAHWAVALDPDLGRAKTDGKAQFELGTALPMLSSDYVDPLLGDRWLAAFAPVGGTGYVVLVQTREDVAIRPSHTLTRLAIGLGVVSVGLWLAWGVFLSWRWHCELAQYSNLRYPRLAT
jgi:hypothetical protein